MALEQILVGAVPNATTDVDTLRAAFLKTNSAISKLDGINAPDLRTAAAFTSENPVILGGQIAFETDTRKSKMGDGVTPFLALAYSGGPSEGVGSDFVRPEDYLGATEFRLNSAFAEAMSSGAALFLATDYEIAAALDVVSLTTQRLRVTGPGALKIVANIPNPLIIEAVWPSAVAIAATTFTTHTFPGDSVAATECTRITALGHGCSIGDLIKVVADDAIPGSTLGPGGAIRRIGEFAYVADVSGDDIYVSGVLVEAYATAPRLVRVNQDARLLWDGPGFDATPAQTWSTTSFVARGLYRPNIKASFRNGYHCGLQTQSCFQAEIDLDGSKFLNRVSSLGIAGYVVQDIGSHQTIGRVTGLDARHAYTTGSNSTAAGGGAAYLNGRTLGAKVDTIGVGCSSAAADLHSEAMGCELFVTASGGILGEDSNGAAVQLRGRGNKASGTARNTPHGAQVYAQVDGDAWDLELRDFDYSGFGDGFRFGGASPSIRSKRCWVIRGRDVVDNTRAGYIQNADSLTVEDRYVALLGSQAGANFAIQNGASSLTLRRCTLDLTRYTGSGVDYAAFASASTLNELIIDTPVVIDPNGKLRSWFNGAGTTGTVTLINMPSSALSDGVWRNADSITKIVTAPGGSGTITSVNGQTGPAVTITRESLGAEAETALIAWTTAARDLAPGDDRAVLLSTHSAPTLTIRAQGSVAYPADMMVSGYAENGLTIAVESGATIDGSTASITVAAGSGWVLIRKAADTWVYPDSGSGDWIAQGDRAAVKAALLTGTDEEVSADIGDILAAATDDTVPPPNRGLTTGEEGQPNWLTPLQMRSWLELSIGSGGVQGWDADLASIAALTGVSDKALYATGASAWALMDMTAAGRALMDDADAAAQCATLGLTIGTDVQGWDADLASIAALTGVSDKALYATGASAWALMDMTAAGRALMDDADAAAQRATLGLTIGTDVQGFDAATLKSNATATLTVGYADTEFAGGSGGAISSGTFTPAVANGYTQALTNNGAHTLAAPSGTCNILVVYTNGASAGAVTLSGFTQTDGDPLDVVSGHKFHLYITKTSAGSHLTIKRMV